MKFIFGNAVGISVGIVPVKLLDPNAKVVSDDKVYKVDGMVPLMFQLGVISNVFNAVKLPMIGLIVPMNPLFCKFITTTRFGLAPLQLIPPHGKPHGSVKLFHPA